MKTLKDILYKTGIKQVIGTTECEITNVQFDSRKVEANSLFVAVKGTQSDGHNYIDKSISLGAIAIVCDVLPEKQLKGITYIVVENSSFALGIIASNYYDNPSEKLTLIGITGTNGKTTIVTLLHDLFSKLGYHSGLLSTVANKIQSRIIPSTHTTPDAIALNALLNEMVDEGCEYCFMEVSSHAVDQNRIAGLSFAGGVFTNITHDHLDYHKTFDKYLKAKKSFFDKLPSSSFALSNLDDKNGAVMLQNTKAKKSHFALKRMADFKGKIIENHFSGLQIDINGFDVWCRLTGEFNASNLLAVYAVAVLSGQEDISVLTSLSDLNAAEGRFDYFTNDENVVAVVDYAHTPDAIDNVLKTINAIRTGNEQLITVVGAGGDRDKDKRPVMAKLVSRASDKVILTSDNPRTEEPEAIIEDMLTGVGPENKRKVLSITNRKEAIKTACALAKSGDIILVAGKGHEKYQDIKGVKHPFDDKEILKEILINKDL